MSKKMDTIKNIGGRAAAVGGALTGLLFMGLVMAGQASATPADPGEAAIEGFGSKVTTYGTAMIAVVVLAVGLFLAVKYIRKAASHA